MAKISERLLSTTYYGKKGGTRLIPNAVNLLGEDSICMVNLLETKRVIVFFIT